MTVDLDCNVPLRVVDGLSGMVKLIELAKETRGVSRSKAKGAFEDFVLALGPLAEKTDHKARFEDLKTQMRAVKV